MKWPYLKCPPTFAPGSFSTQPGVPVQPIFEPRFDGSTTHLVQVGTKDLQEDINAHEPYTDIAYMLNRLSHGDTSVLAKQPATYGDFTQMPQNPTDIINYISNAQAQFDSLAAQERAKYNNDWRVWANAVWSDSVSRPIFGSDTVVDRSSDSQSKEVAKIES